MSNPFGSLSQFFSGLIGGGATDIAPAASGLPQSIQDWFGSLGGELASGLEAGFVAFFKDIWDVIIGPLEVIVGFIFILFAIGVMFHDDLMQLGAMAGMFLI